MRRGGHSVRIVNLLDAEWLTELLPHFTTMGRSVNTVCVFMLLIMLISPIGRSRRMEDFEATC